MAGLSLPCKPLFPLVASPPRDSNASASPIGYDCEGEEGKVTFLANLVLPPSRGAPGFQTF